jgi:micrococcal nuclease
VKAEVPGSDSSGGLHPIIVGKISIRVNGIDTPEIKGKCDKEKYDAQQAKEMVADILKDAEQITLKNMERGKYFRIAADVIVDGENLADLLIEAGMAVRYDGGKKTKNWPLHYIGWFTRY